MEAIIPYVSFTDNGILRSMQEIATFGGGCFWCIEAIMIRIRGVTSVVSGYAGGEMADPTYTQVSSGNTGHAEVVQVTFDTTSISYEQLITIFLLMHDPTTRNKQGNDIGTQYRSIIFYHSPQQKKTVRNVIQKLTSDNVYTYPIITDIEPYVSFYPAESYHQNYYDSNNMQPYCQVIIHPKIQKLRKSFAHLLKSESQ